MRVTGELCAKIVVLNANNNATSKNDFNIIVIVSDFKPKKVSIYLGALETKIGTRI